MTGSGTGSLLDRAGETVAGLYRAGSRLLGRRPDAQTEPIEVQSDLCLGRAARQTDRYAQLALPETLLRACAVEPLEAGDARFVGREQPKQRFVHVFERWRTGQRAIIAITGPQGCGMTSFLKQTAQATDDAERYCYARLTRRPYGISDTLLLLSEAVGCREPCESVEELVAYINALSPRVLAIDNGHFLACRIMGANAAIRVFGAVMVATQRRHLWVLGCEDYAWRRLAYVYGADRYFTDRIELSLFSELELGQCLAARLRTADTSLTNAESGEQEPVLELPARHLSLLHKLSNGKPDLAFFYFLNSLLVEAESGRLNIQPIAALDFAVLRQLISEELFTLAEVAAHGQLTISDHRAVFRSSREESWLLLERLYHQCLLEKEDTGAEPVYRLIPLYSDVIARHLSNANYLY